MTIIKPEDVTASVADALQHISYFHPLDYIQALAEAYKREESPAARDAIAQILTNSRMSAEGHRPICQDTGIVTVFVKWGQGCVLAGKASLQLVIDEGVRRAYLDPANPLRASIVADPIFRRDNTRDNAPSVVHVELVPGDRVKLTIGAKGGGSENKAKFKMLNPSDSLVDWVLETIPTMGAGWCPPGMLGIGVGGTAEKAMLMAKEALMAPIDMAQLTERGARTPIEALRIELHEKINALGIGAQGLGGLTTVLDVKVREWPTHAACKPVALIPNCAATRHAHITLDGTGPAYLPRPDLSVWPRVSWSRDSRAIRVDLDKLTPELMASWNPGDRLLLSGKMLTGRDAAHKRIQDMIARGKAPPVDFNGRVIYYVGPVGPVGDEVVGPAGPTTATRLDRFTDMMLDLGLLAMVGKAERGAATISSIKAHRRAYLTAVGGAAYLVSRAIRSSRVVAFADLGMEAIHEFDVRDMPVTVAVNPVGESIHTLGPARWARPIISRRSSSAAS